MDFVILLAGIVFMCLCGEVSAAQVGSPIPGLVIAVGLIWMVSHAFRPRL